MGKRANTDKEKEEVMRRLLIVWKCFPGLRFGQLIANIIGFKKDPFYVEDFDLVRDAEAFVKQFSCG